ncbi:hypothetical protein BACOVA_04235 [Bacteroides ovatus ATCC 8483]|uniref:Uncharacterized protein n=1 Tax=Bacteroides ovatus (strain ATCC 8483 / DSM 1896 / JCM 5824 / BCRC 10623 / CCUG 4943 / NCTC 11153) TaxID=411476 RepID=A0AAN3D7U3_BACO1|nr:hypothetical protein BACOVA_04235 [Bacteroides ovatus ATCC 8483]
MIAFSIKHLCFQFCSYDEFLDERILVSLLSNKLIN